MGDLEPAEAVTRCGRQGRTILHRLGLTAEHCDMIAAEIAAVCPALTGALEDGDCWSVAIGTAWQWQQRGTLGPAYLRVRVRGALRDLVRRESMATGIVPQRHVGKRGYQTVRWPVYWPAADVPVHLPCRIYASWRKRQAAKAAA